MSMYGTKKKTEIASAIYLLDLLNKTLTNVAEGIDDEKLKEYIRQTTMLQIHLEGKLNV
jgi:hypothetical protein